MPVPNTFKSHVGYKLFINGVRFLVLQFYVMVTKKYFLDFVDFRDFKYF